MGLDILFVSASSAVGADFHVRADDFAGEGFRVSESARAGAGQADVDGLYAERFHQVQDFDFFSDARIVDRRILQAVAERFVVEHHAAANRDFGAGVGVPIVDEFVFHAAREILQ